MGSNIAKSYKKQHIYGNSISLVEISDFGMTGIRNEIDKLLAYTGAKDNCNDDVKM